MPGFELALVLLVAAAVIVALSRRLGIPYPIALVLGGILLGLVLAAVPTAPDVTLDPDLVLVVFLPPIVFAAAWRTPVRDVRQNLRPVLLLSVGLVLVTTVVVGAVAAGSVRGLPLAAALALGAIVSPPDALAATTVLADAAVPRRIRAILEEESLLNDATALTSYRTAVVAAMSGAFIVGPALATFLVAAVGGVLVGLLVAAVTSFIWERLDDPPVSVTLSLVVPYAAYLPAEHLGASGVIAAVACGIVLGRRSSTIFSPATRVLSSSVWDIVEFALNGYAFLLVGVEAPAILRDLITPLRGDLVLATVAITAATVLTRFVWVYGSLYLPGGLARPAAGALAGDRRAAIGLVVSWSGMRGAISLAAALALPADFPQRNFLLFVTAVVIAVTLLGQGLTLGPLLRRLRLGTSGDELEEETLARNRSVDAALAQLRSLARLWPAHGPLLRSLEDRYRHRREHLVEADEDGELTISPEREQERAEHRAILHAIVAAEREAVIALRDDGQIGDEILRRVERGLDLEELRLDELA